jgi:hypothetical protein
MHRHLRPLLLALVVLASGVAPALAGGGAVRLLGNCRAPATTPARVTIACGDGNLWVQGIRWQDWGAATAVGTGIVYANPCVPDCASVPVARFQRAKVVVLATRLRGCPGGFRAYARLSFAFPAVSAPPPKTVRLALSPTSFGCKGF